MRVPDKELRRIVGGTPLMNQIVDKLKEYTLDEIRIICERHKLKNKYLKKKRRN